MNIVEVTDIHGNKRKVDLDNLDAKHFAKDGDRMSFTMMCMDTAGGLFITDSEQLKPKGAPMTTDEYQKISDQAYDKMVSDLDFRTRNKIKSKPGETPTEAYAAARAELELAWRNNSNGN